MNNKFLEEKSKPKAKISDCWYTPPQIVNLIQQCLGEITLDPCADDGKHIEALQHFTISDDGLSHQWFGKVFMNPPYSCPGVWIAKLQEEFNSGRVTEAIALVPVATDTNWFHPLISSNLICFWKGRIRFLDVNYEPKMPARQSHALIYWGNNQAKFREVFSSYGSFNFLEEKIFDVGDRVNIRHHKEKYYSDDNWGIVGSISSKNQVNIRMGDRFYIAVDIEDIYLDDKPTSFLEEKASLPSPKDFLNFDDFKSAFDKWKEGLQEEEEEEYCHIEAIEIWEQEKQQCNSHTPASLQESPALNLESKQLELVTSSKQNYSSKITQTLKQFSSADIQISQSTTTLETISPNQENLSSIQLDSPVQEHQLLEMAQDLSIQNQVSGLKPCVVSQTVALASSSLKILKGLSITAYEQFLGDSEWQATLGTIRSSYRRRKLERRTEETDSLLLPTPTTYCKGSTGSRPAGQTRLEQKLKPYLTKGDKLNPAIPGWMMGFPVGWVEKVLMETGEAISIQLPFTQEYVTTSISAENVTTSTPVQSAPSKQQLQSREYATLQNSLNIKAITLHNPWAWLVGRYKFYETRDWPTNYRGKIAIHAAKKQDDTEYWCSVLNDLLPPIEQLSFKSVVAIADLTDCIKMTEEFISQQSEIEIRCGLWKPGRYAWKLENVQILTKPVPARGMPGLWDIELLSSQLSVVSQKLRPSDVKLDLYVCDISPNVGKVIERWQTYFRVDWGNETKSYFWERDEYLINELAIAPQPLVDKFLEENARPAPVPNPDITELKPGDKVRFTTDIRFRDIDENSKLPASAILAEKGDWAEVCSHASNGRVALSKSGTGEVFTWYCKYLEPFLEENTTPQLQCTQQIQINSKVKVTKVRNSNLEHWVGYEATVTAIDSESISVLTGNGRQKKHLTLKHGWYELIPENFLEEKSEAVAPAQKLKPSKQKGCLYPYLENKKLKDGTVATYPRVAGHRELSNPRHWRWGFKWEEKVDGEWKGRSLGVPLGAIPMIQSMQKEGVPLDEIIGFIKRSKANKHCG